MKDSQLRFDRTCHVLYSKACKKEIRKKLALHYPPDGREAMWERVQEKYVEFLSDWRTDLGGKKNFHNGRGGNYDCIALMAYYAVCRDVTGLAEIEEMEGNLFLGAFRMLRKMKFIDCNKPFFKKADVPRLRKSQTAVRPVGRFSNECGSVRPRKADLLRVYRVPDCGVCPAARSACGDAGALQSGF